MDIVPQITGGKKTHLIVIGTIRWLPWRKINLDPYILRHGALSYFDSEPVRVEKLTLHLKQPR